MTSNSNRTSQRSRGTRRRKRDRIGFEPPKTARVVVSIALLACVLGALAGRIVDLQVSPDQRVLEDVMIPLGVVKVPAARGNIVDRHGRTIALSLPAATIVVDPRVVIDAAGTAHQLASLIDVSVERLQEKVSGNNAFAYLARQLDPVVGVQVEELGLPGVAIIVEPRRENPNGRCSGLAAVGRVNIDHVGMSGIEEAYDSHLSGDSGMIVKEIGTDGTTIPGGSQQVINAVPGNDIRVTLDRNIQYQAEQLLLEAVASAGANLGVALVSIPKTGEILAMANIRRGANGLVGCTRENLAVTWSYEPGSIFKPVTMAGVLSSGVIGELDPLPIRATTEISGHKFSDTPWHDVMEWTPTDILSHSSNVGTITLAMLMGERGMQQIITALGLGTETELEFKGEASGIVLPFRQWNSLTLPNVAIGQGIATTPMQMLMVYNIIANAGVREPPRLVVDEAAVRERVRVLDSATAEALLRMLGHVVQRGTGQAAAVNGYSVAGKTGTAWQPCDQGYVCLDELGRTTDQRHYTASFVGIISNYDGPALSVIVIIDEPSGPQVSGGKLAAPVVADLAQYALRQLRIPAKENLVSYTRERARVALPPPADMALGLEELDS